MYPVEPGADAELAGQGVHTPSALLYWPTAHEAEWTGVVAVVMMIMIVTGSLGVIIDLAVRPRAFIQLASGWGLR